MRRLAVERIRILCAGTGGRSGNRILQRAPPLQITPNSSVAIRVTTCTLALLHRAKAFRPAAALPNFEAFAAMSDVTLILRKMEEGNSHATEELLTLVYQELRKLAAAKMSRESEAMTLQPTALVHEAWLRLGGEDQPTWQNRAHFFGAAAESMRRILIDRARKRRAQRHGGDQHRVDAEALELVPSPAADDDQLLAIHEALDRFAAEEPQKAELVKLRYFVGLTIEEVATTLGISAGTAKRWWAYSRARLYRDLKPQ
jgi:RNA polymerase sigma factor (TIGR02999 family)